MLYDPKWEVEVKADPFSLESLIAWLETRPAEASYRWDNPRSCLLGQWISYATSLTDSELGAMSCQLGVSNIKLARIAYPPDDMGAFDYTFGGALDRARKALGQ